jgi:hypothetical protein
MVDAGTISPNCSECGQPLRFVAEIPGLGLHEYICVFKCSACARILVVKERQTSSQLQPLVDRQ